MANIRTTKVADVKSLLTAGISLEKVDITGYAGTSGSDISFKRALWKAQHYKCAWCEHKVECLGYEVEHFRPKKAAVGRDGRTRPGYWWLAWTWSNLLFACLNCNRYSKGSRFPLREEGRRLKPEEQPPGRERPLLLDPAAPGDPRQHLIHRPVRPDDWWVFPREGSREGAWTLKILDLNRDELRTLRGSFYRDHLQPQVERLGQRVHQVRAQAVDVAELRADWAALIRTMGTPTYEYSAFALDVLDHHFPAPLRRAMGLPAPM